MNCRRVWKRPPGHEITEGYCVGFDPTGNRIVFTCSRGLTRILRLADGSTETFIRFDALTSAFNPDGLVDRGVRA